jgi:hypothetical protein
LQLWVLNLTRGHIDGWPRGVSGTNSSNLIFFFLFLKNFYSEL